MFLIKGWWSIAPVSRQSTGVSLFILRMKPSRSTLQKADLQNATLQDADLTGANLSEADLEGTDLSKAALRNADFRNAKWQKITDVKLANVFGIKNAPADFLNWAMQNGAVSYSTRIGS